MARTWPLTRPAPAAESAGRGPPSPLGRGQRKRFPPGLSSGASERFRTTALFPGERVTDGGGGVRGRFAIALPVGPRASHQKGPCFRHAELCNVGARSLIPNLDQGDGDRQDQQCQGASPEEELIGQKPSFDQANSQPCQKSDCREDDERVRKPLHGYLLRERRLIVADHELAAVMVYCIANAFPRAPENESRKEDRR